MAKKYTENEIYEIIVELFPNMDWRRFQLETIIQILLFYQENPNGKVLVDAPTGSGKSIISLVTSRVLNSEYFGKKTGYILAPETYLQDQYEYTVNDYKLRVPSVKGVDNYDCNQNFQKISLGYCRERHISGAKLKELDCYATCEYYSRRDAAARSKLAILNYNYWIIQQSYVNRQTEEGLFQKRDFCFFDESHNIVNIINNQFSPKISSRVIYESSKILDWVKDNPHVYNSSDGCLISTKDLSLLKSQISSTINDLLHLNKKSNTEDFKNLRELFKNLSMIIKYHEPFLVSNHVSAEKNGLVPDSNKKIIPSFDFIKDVYCKVEDYIDIVKDNVDGLLCRVDGENEVKFFSLDTSGLMKKHFHEYYNFGVFLSATFLNLEFFKQYCAITNSKVLIMPSTFDFSKSPIYFSKKYNMGYNQKEKYREDQAKKIIEIINDYVSGIIHTGNYENSRYLQSVYKGHKIEFYANTSEKKELLGKLKRKKNFFIAGPSLLEGIDLPGECSRCQIFMKIPYLNLGDNFTKMRFEKSKTWYMWETSLNFVQGIGRSNRFVEDYCDTFILDSTFQNLLRQNLIPKFIQDRIQLI